MEFAEGLARFLDIWPLAGAGRASDAGTARAGRGEGLTRAERIRLIRHGETLLGQGRAVEAEQVFRELLARMDAGLAYGGDLAAYDRALTLSWLGRCLEAQGRTGQAIDMYRKGARRLPDAGTFG